MQTFESINVIQLLALIVGLVAFLFAGIVYFISQHLVKKLDRFEKKMEEQVSNEYHVFRIAENTVQLLVRVNQALQNQHIMVSLLIRKNGIGQVAMGPYLEAHNDASRALNRYLQTLLLFSENKIWRQSALNQLSEDFGDADTLRLLVELKSHERELGDDLSRAVVTLQERLDGRSNSIDFTPRFLG